MKSLSTASINQACQRYINLKSDKEYKSYYKAFTALNLLAQNPRFEAGSVYASLKSHILDKWDLKHSIIQRDPTDKLADRHRRKNLLPAVPQHRHPSG